MPFEGKTIVERRLECVLAALQEGANRAALYRHYGIDAKTGRKWIARYLAEGRAGLEDRSRRPRTSPRQTDADREAAVLALRDQHPTWGARKLHARLETLGLVEPPAPSTITSILHRHDRIGTSRRQPAATTRFARQAPNELWQVDFKGHHALQQGRVAPLSILDDHSRFAIGLFACGHQRGELVQTHLITCFRTYGLPDAILADHGPPWGSAGRGSLTWLTAWWIRLGIRVYHGRPLHPQTRGKVERWHRTLKADLFQFAPFPDLAAAQRGCDRFRTEYNTDRPHEALAMAVPASRYAPSARPYPENLPEIGYSADHTVCRVHQHGTIWFRGRTHFISEALAGLPVGVRPTATDGVFVVRFCDQAITRLDLRHPDAQWG